jgi:hypothetical protein
MKSARLVFGCVLVALLLLASGWVMASAQQSTAQSLPSSVKEAVGTSFTFQGQLTYNSRPITDNCLMRFKLFNAAAAGDQVGPSYSPLAAVPVQSGLFTVVMDFGPVYDGTALWLQIEVQCTTDVGYVNLGRQRLTTAPQAVNADLLDNVEGTYYERSYLEGTVNPGTSLIIEIPHWYPFTLQLASGWPDYAGVAFITGMENDWFIGITYILYNGNGTSSYGGASCAESSNTVLLQFGHDNYIYQLKCPGEADSIHNLVLVATNADVELRYKLIY